MMKFNRSLIVLAVAAIGSFGAPVAMAQSAGGPALAARSSDAGGVRVVVKPKSTGTGSAWEFEVTMDTHTKPLNDDLMKTSALVDDSKRRYTPLAWQGIRPVGTIAKRFFVSLRLTNKPGLLRCKSRGSAARARECSNGAPTSRGLTSCHLRAGRLYTP